MPFNLFDNRKRKQLKGQSELIQYTITILLSVIILISASLIIFTLYDSAVKADIRSSMQQIAAQTADRILKLYEVGKSSRIQPANTSVLIAQDSLRLPATISDRKYEIDLIPSSLIWSNIINTTVNNQSALTIINSPSAKVVVKTLSDPIISISYNLPNIDVTVQGKGDPTNSKLYYYRYNVNSTTFDKIIFGDQSILIDIQSIQ